jgi:hypothetical protein
MEQSTNLFVTRLEFLASQNMDRWIKRSLLSQRPGPTASDPLQTNIEIKYLQRIVEWLERYRSIFEESGKWARVELGLTGGLDKDVLSDPYDIVGEVSGKASGWLWLMEKFTCKEAEMSFLLALKYYLR